MSALSIISIEKNGYYSLERSQDSSVSIVTKLGAGRTEKSCQVKVKVKQSRYRPAVAQRVPGIQGSQIS
jgi:hypothetical protein